MYIFLNEILKYYSEYFTEFYLEANDSLRHRLYRQTLNKFLDKTTWEEEYLRLCSEMGLPPHLDHAKILYESWYDIRVAKYVESFDTLTAAFR